MATYKYEPNYAASPGAVLEEHLAVRGLSQAEFARRCGRSAKLICQIVAGKASVEPATALQFERVLGMSARIWLGMEADYRLHARCASGADDQRRVAPGERSLVTELAKRRAIEGRAGDGKLGAKPAETDV